jgi:hypothetical protein
LTGDEFAPSPHIRNLAEAVGLDVYAEAYQAARHAARARYARSINVPCAFGHCVNIYDPVEKQLNGGFGAAGCAHEYLPGHNARHPEGLPKPRFQVKATGRNRGRIERSIRRHRGVAPSGLMTWMEDIYGENDRG